MTAITQRQTAAVLYLTLEDAAGETSVPGVTAEHSLYDAAAGWTEAGDLVAGDIVLDSMLEPLTVLALRVDDTPQLVHNLEVGGAHTYFAGDMTAWAHNSGWPTEKVDCFEDALRGALSFIEEATGSPFSPINTSPGKWGGVSIRGSGGTQIRIETDRRHGSHVNVTCPIGKRTFEFPGDIPGWARRGG